MPKLPPTQRIALTDDLPPRGKGASKAGKRLPSLGPDRSVSRSLAMFTNLLSLFCAALMIGLLYLLWRCQEAEQRAIKAARQAELTGNFSDGVLQDLALARVQNTKLDRERENLVKLLGEAERLHASLRGELSSWRQKHEDVIASSQEAAATLTNDNEALKKDLSTTRANLDVTDASLRQARAENEAQQAQAGADMEASLQKARSLAMQKTAAEQQNRALDLENQKLDADNQRMEGDVERLRGLVKTLESTNSGLDAINAGLVSQSNHLRARIKELEAKVRSLEQDRDRDKSKKATGNQP